MISLIEWGIEFVDKEYQKTNLDAGGELGQIRESMNKNAYIEYQKQDPNDPNAKKTVNTMMNPTRYEAYLQIYKSPDKAIDNYSTYVKLRDKKDPRSPDEEKEFQKLKRIDDLADAYVASHRYMLEKDSYNQQDVDYTFALEKMEKKIPTLGQLRKNTASAIYKSLMLEKIFGNVSQRLENNFTQKDMSDKKKVQEWLDNDMCTCIGRRPAEMKTVIKGIKKAMPELDETGLQVYLMDMINDRWIKIFSDNAKNTADKDSPLKKAHSPVSTGFDKIKKDANSKLSKKLKDMIHSLD